MFLTDNCTDRTIESMFYRDKIKEGAVTMKFVKLAALVIVSGSCMNVFYASEIERDTKTIVAEKDVKAGAAIIRREWLNSNLSHYVIGYVKGLLKHEIAVDYIQVHRRGKDYSVVLKDIPLSIHKKLSPSVVKVLGTCPDVITVEVSKSTRLINQLSGEEITASKREFHLVPLITFES